MVLPERDGLYHPTTEDEIVELVRHARVQHRKLRVLGSGHSVDDSIFTGGSAQNINVLLNRFRNVQFANLDDGNQLVTAEAGCNLGADPGNLFSNEANSLLFQMANRGCTLPDLGGITHQTVAGFTSTGSSGSTVHHSVYKRIEAIRLVDGRGDVQEFTRSDADPTRFEAAGVAMGLFGVVSRLSFRSVPSFHIRGTEAITRIEDCGIDLFGNGSDGLPSLVDFFRQKEYVRLLWWPIADPQRVVVWQAKKMEPADYDEETGPPDRFRRRPYRAFAGPPLIAQLFVAAIGSIVTRRWPPGPRRTRRLNQGMPRIVDRFVPLDDNGPQYFWDDSWRGLPMDNQINDALIPLEFTEMKIPLTRTAEVMQALKPHYDANKIHATGPLAVEIYPTSPSDFWMNPAFGNEPFLKVDILWFRNRRTKPEETFFPQFWNLLRPFDFRPHWGKYLPPATPSWTDFLRRQYPQWSAWQGLRSQFDPDDVFLSRYWRNHLGL